MGCEVKGVPAEHLGFVWEFAAPLLATVPQDDFTLWDIYRLIDERNAQLWIVTDDHVVIGVFVTELVRFPSKLVVRVVLGAGKRAKDWLPGVRDVVIPWAKSQGCTAIEVDGRPGWEKLVNQVFGPGWARQRRVQIRGEI